MNYYCPDISDPAKKLSRIYPESIGVNTIDTFLVNKTGITSDFFFQSTVNFIKSSYFMVICDDLGVNTAYLPLGINEPIEITNVQTVVNRTERLQPTALFIDNINNSLQLMEYALSTQLYFTSDDIYEPRQMVVYDSTNYLIVNKDNNHYVAIKDCTDVIFSDIQYDNDFFSNVIWGAIYPLLGKAPVSKDYVDARDLLTLRDSKIYIDSFNLASINNRVVSSEIAIEPNLDIQYEVFIFNGIVETELTQILTTKEILNAQYLIVNNRPYSINISINSVLTEIEPNNIVSFIQTGELENKTITLAYKTVNDIAIKDIIADIETINADIVDIKIDITGLQDSKIDITEKAIAGGVATLDDTTGKVPLSQIPNSIIGDMHYVGIWNAQTNTPILEQIPNVPLGFFYRVTVAGTQFGIDFSIGDAIISSGEIGNPTNWDRIPNNNAVNSVNSKIGDVVLTKADLNIVNATPNVYGEVKFDNYKVILNEYNQLTIEFLDARTDLKNHATINLVKLNTDITTEDLGLQNKLTTGTHTTLVNNTIDVTTGVGAEQIPTNSYVAENHYTKEEAEVGSDTKPGEMDIRSPKIEFYGEKNFFNYYNINDGDSLTNINPPDVTKQQMMFLSASQRYLTSVVFFHEDYLKDRPQVLNIEGLQEFYLDINGMRFNTSKYKVPVDAGKRITYNGKVTAEGNSINTNENNFVENSKSGTYDTKTFDTTNIDHMFIRARIEIVSTSTGEMNIIADPTSKLFALKMTSNHLLTFMKIQTLYFQDVKASIVQGQKTRYEIEAKEEFYRIQNFLTIGGYVDQLNIGA